MNKYDKTMMSVAKSFAEHSYCVRAKVGAVITLEDDIIATGYNGTIAGKDNCCEEKVLYCPCGLKHIVDESQFSNNNVAYSYTCSCGKLNNYTEDYLNSNIDIKTNDFTLHAEQNALMKCAKKGYSTDGATIYITTSPCKMCSKLIIQAGIKRVVYGKEYKDDGGIVFLKENNIIVEQNK